MLCNKQHFLLVYLRSKKLQKNLCIVKCLFFTFFYRLWMQILREIVNSIGAKKGNLQRKVLWCPVPKTWDLSLPFLWLAHNWISLFENELWHTFVKEKRAGRQTNNSHQSLQANLTFCNGHFLEANFTIFLCRLGRKNGVLIAYEIDGFLARLSSIQKAICTLKFLSEKVQKNGWKINAAIFKDDRNSNFITFLFSWKVWSRPEKNSAALLCNQIQSRFTEDFFPGYNCHYKDNRMSSKLSWGYQRSFQNLQNSTFLWKMEAGFDPFSFYSMYFYIANFDFALNFNFLYYICSWKL